VSKDFAKAFGRFDNGFTLTFENGLVLSTRFGPGTYSDNHWSRSYFIDRDTKGRIHARHKAREPMSSLFSDTVEVGVWDNAKPGPQNWISGWQEVIKAQFPYTPYDDVCGYVTMPEWLQIIDWCRAWKPE
jgi:hypothetical protein